MSADAEAMSWDAEEADGVVLEPGEIAAPAASTMMDDIEEEEGEEEDDDDDDDDDMSDLSEGERERLVAQRERAAKREARARRIEETRKRALEEKQARLERLERGEGEQESDASGDGQKQSGEDDEEDQVEEIASTMGLKAVQGVREHNKQMRDLVKQGGSNRKAFIRRHFAEFRPFLTKRARSNYECITESDDSSDEEEEERDAEAAAARAMDAAVAAAAETEEERAARLAAEAERQQARQRKRRKRRKRKPYKNQHLPRLPDTVPDLKDDIITVVKRQPKIVVNGTMRNYQLDGLNWLVSRHDNVCGGILGDEMGLGKTLQVISFLAYLKESRGAQGPHLVVVPLSVMASWMNEFRRWCPTLRVVRFHGPAAERQRVAEEECQLGQFDAVVTTFETVVNDEDFFRHSFHWQYLIIDEAHRVKNEHSLQAQALASVRRYNTILLTGTPTQNNMHELWALLNFLLPKLFTSSRPFDECFDLAKSVVDEELLAKAHALLRPLMLRRVKAEIENKLPPKTETKFFVPLSKCQTFWYKRLLQRDLGKLPDEKRQEQGLSSPTGSSSGSGGGAWKQLMSLFMQLRKVCNHPYLFPSAEPEYSDLDSEEPLSDGDTHAETRRKDALAQRHAARRETMFTDLVSASGKLHMLDKLLTKLKREGHRVLLFSLFTGMLDILEDYCRHKGLKYARLDGSTNRVRRGIDIRRFNAPNSDLFIYLISTRAGGLGINLQTADTVIHYDSDFNPQVDLQAQDRAHRIGQTKPVHVYRFVTEGTVEERLIARAEKKLYLDMMVNRLQAGGGKVGGSEIEQLQKMSKTEVLSMLMFGAERIFRAGSLEGDGMDDDIERVLQRSLEKEQDMKKETNSPRKEVKKQRRQEAGSEGAVLETNALQSVSDFNVQLEELGIREFQGKKYGKKKAAGGSSAAAIAREWRRANGQGNSGGTDDEDNEAAGASLQNYEASAAQHVKHRSRSRSDALQAKRARAEALALARREEEEEEAEEERKRQEAKKRKLQAKHSRRAKRRRARERRRSKKQAQRNAHAQFDYAISERHERVTGEMVREARAAAKALRKQHKKARKKARKQQKRARRMCNWAQGRRVRFMVNGEDVRVAQLPGEVGGGEHRGSSRRGSLRVVLQGEEVHKRQWQMQQEDIPRQGHGGQRLVRFALDGREMHSAHMHVDDGGEMMVVNGQEEGVVAAQRLPLFDSLVVRLTRTRRPLPAGLESSEESSSSEASEDSTQTSNYKANGKWLHQDWCHLCKIGGELVCCHWCPRTYHPECIGLTEVPKGYFSCPQHSCSKCKRKAQEAGGLLFRCVVCPCSYCEDHLPSEDAGRIDLDRCEATERLGYKQPQSAFFIVCSNSCASYYLEYKQNADGAKPTKDEQKRLSWAKKKAAKDPHLCPCREPQKKKEKLYCVCQTPYDETRFYIGCDSCRGWFHGDCVGVSQDDHESDAPFECKQCLDKEKRKANRGRGRRGRKAQMAFQAASESEESSESDYASEATPPTSEVDEEEQGMLYEFMDNGYVTQSNKPPKQLKAILDESDGENEWENYLDALNEQWGDGTKPLVNTDNAVLCKAWTHDQVAYFLQHALDLPHLVERFHRSRVTGSEMFMLTALDLVLHLQVSQEDAIVLLTAQNIALQQEDADADAAADAAAQESGGDGGENAGTPEQGLEKEEGGKEGQQHLDQEQELDFEAEMADVETEAAVDDTNDMFDGGEQEERENAQTPTAAGPCEASVGDVKVEGGVEDSQGGGKKQGSRQSLAVSGKENEATPGKQGASPRKDTSGGVSDVEWAGVV